MKRLLNVLALTLAFNFLAVAGGIGWLWNSGNLNREKVFAIRQMLFPATAPATQPVVVETAAGATTRPMLRLEELLERQAGRPANEQVAFMQRSFDAQIAQLDRRHRELVDLQRQVELAQQQMTKDREALESEKQALADHKAAAARLQADQGFQDSLELYQSMLPKQVKEIFMRLDDESVQRFLTAMEARTAGKIIREFKTPEEMQRVQVVLEKIQSSQQQAGAETAATD